MLADDQTTKSDDSSQPEEPLSEDDAKLYRKHLKQVLSQTDRPTRKFNKYHSQMLIQMMKISEMKTMVLSFLNSKRSKSYQEAVLRQRIDEFPEVEALNLNVEVLKMYHFAYEEEYQRARQELMGGAVD